MLGYMVFTQIVIIKISEREVLLVMWEYHEATQDKKNIA